MVGLPEAMGLVAPYYNLAFTIIVIYLFIQLFRTHRDDKEGVFFAPWGWIFAALMIYVIEEVITVLRVVGLVQIPLQINGFFELVIIAVFIYAILLQRDWMRQAFASGPIMPAPSKISPSKKKR